MDKIDSLEKENGIHCALENKLQTKRGPKGKKNVVDLVRFIWKFDFLFRMKKDKFEFEKTGKFRNFTFDLELRPYDWLYLDGEMEINTKNQAMKTGSFEATFHPRDDLRLNFGYRYEKRFPDPRNQFTFDLDYKITPKWQVGVYERIDFQRGKIEEQQFKVTRDLHCWEVEFVYDIDGGNFLKDNFTMWFAFKIKAFPDLQLGLSRSFKKRPPGSIRD